MGDEVLARLAPLVDVALAGEGEGALDRLAIDGLVAVGRVLADDCEQVAEQHAVGVGEVLGDLIDRGRRAARFLGADLNMATAINRGASPVLGR
jgi:hypothetical protein